MNKTAPDRTSPPTQRHSESTGSISNAELYHRLGAAICLCFLGQPCVVRGQASHSLSQRLAATSHVRKPRRSACPVPVSVPVQMSVFGDRPRRSFTVAATLRQIDG
jgi:hypothetical protein